MKIKDFKNTHTELEFGTCPQLKFGDAFYNSLVFMIYKSFIGIENLLNVSYKIKFMIHSQKKFENFFACLKKIPMLIFRSSSLPQTRVR